MIRIRPEDVVLRAGGQALARYGVPARRVSRAHDGVRQEFTRASTAWTRSRGGVLVPCGADVPRINWLDLDGDGVCETPAQWLEPEGTNRVPAPSDFAASWIGAATVAGGQSDPRGGSGASLLTDTDNVGIESAYIVVNVIGDGTKTAGIFAASGTAPAFDLSLYDYTQATHRNRVRWTWAGGVPAGVSMDGSGTLYDAVPYGGGWYWCQFSANAVVAGNENRMFIYPATAQASGTGSTYFYNGQVTDSAFSGSPVVGAVSRGMEIAHWPLDAVAPGVASPQAAWTHSVKWQVSTNGAGGLVFPRLWQLGDGAADAVLFIYINGAGALGIKHVNGVNAVDDQTIVMDPLTVGDVAQAVVVWNGDGTGSLFLYSGGAFVGSAVLNGIPPASAWNNGANLYVGSRNSGAQGLPLNVIDQVLIRRALQGTGQEIVDAFQALPPAA